MKKNYLILILIIALSSFAFHPALAADSQSKTDDSDKYGFEKKDKEAERLKFLEKLLEDKKKVELAIANTKILADKSRNMPYLPELYIRLAELYIEKSRIVFFIRKNKTKSKTKALDNLETNTLKNKAIEAYQRILNDFPDYQERAKVHFYMAHEYRELNKIPEMIKEYRAIIKNHPKSPYVPECLLLLGDHFLGEQNLEMALRHYKKVLNYPDSSAIVIARYKLAWGHVNKREFKKAIKLFELSVKNSDPSKEIDVDTYKRVDVKLESLVDMAFCYPEAYKKNTPMQAISYFRNYSWSRQVFIHVLEKLGYRYLIKKKYKHSVEIYRELAKLEHDVEKKIEYAKNIFECLKEIGEFKHAEKDMAFIIDALELQKYSIRINDKDKKQNIKDFELYARDIATHLHKKAKKLNLKKDFIKAADAYKQYIDFFEEDSPVYTDMMTNYAETLFASGNYLEAGKQYEKLVKYASKPHKKTSIAKAEESKAKKKVLKVTAVKKDKPAVSKHKKNVKISRRDMLNSAIISYYNALKNRKNLNYYQTEFARSGLRQNGELYVKDYPRSSNVPNIKFNISWITFDAGKYDEAISKFKEFIKKYPKGKPAESAVHLVMEAYHLREDYEGLVKFGRTVTSDKRIAQKLRNEVSTIVKASESKLVGALTIDAMNDWELGKQNIEELVEKNKTTGLGEQALNALILSGRDNGKLETIFTAGYKMIKYYPKSDHIADVLAIMADSAGNASQYRVVSKYIEEFARRLPKHKRTPVFLNQAGHFRKTLGQYKLSTIAYQKFLKSAPSRIPGRTEAVFAIVDNCKKIDSPDIAIKTLRSYKRNMREADQVRAEATLAELYREKGDFRSALSHRKKALKKFKNRMLKGNPGLRKAVSEMTLNAVQGSFNSYMGLKLGENIDNQIVANKAKMLANLESGYTSVIQMGEPDTVLKACYYAFEINREFSEFLKNSPLPQGLSEEQQKQYKHLIMQKAGAYMNNAEQYLKTCVNQAHKWQVINKDLVKFYASDEVDPGSFGGESSKAEIAEQFLKDKELRKLHYALYQDSKNSKLLMKLADAYFKRTDYYQAIAIAWNVIDNTGDKNLKDRAYRLIGVSNLYSGNDLAARDAFRNALNFNSSDLKSKINLAGILMHYRHESAARKIYEELPPKLNIQKTGALIHPVAKELYYGYIQSQKKQ